MYSRTEDSSVSRHPTSLSRTHTNAHRHIRTNIHAYGTRDRPGAETKHYNDMPLPKLIEGSLRKLSRGQWASTHTHARTHMHTHTRVRANVRAQTHMHMQHREKSSRSHLQKLDGSICGGRSRGRPIYYTRTRAFVLQSISEMRTETN